MTDSITFEVERPPEDTDPDSTISPVSVDGLAKNVELFTIPRFLAEWKRRGHPPKLLRVHVTITTATEDKAEASA